MTSLVFFLTFAIFSTSSCQGRSRGAAFIDRNMGVPSSVATTIRGRHQSLRRYSLGVTIVAAFNAVVVGIGAYILECRSWDDRRRHFVTA